MTPFMTPPIEFASVSDALDERDHLRRHRFIGAADDGLRLRPELHCDSRMLI